MPNSDLLGSINNPISLLSETCPRPLLQKWSMKTRYANESIDIFKLHKYRDAGNIFIRNVISNPRLSVLQVKLALYLNEILTSDGDVFLTTKSSTYQYSEHYGQVELVRRKVAKKSEVQVSESSTEKANGGYQYVTEEVLNLFFVRKKKNKAETFCISMPRDHMLSIMDAAHVLQLDSSPIRLVNALQTLHDFGYITVTPLFPEYTQNGKSRKDELAPSPEVKQYKTVGLFEVLEANTAPTKIKEKLPPQSRARLRHIQLTSQMQTIDFTRTWLRSANADKPTSKDIEAIKKHSKKTTA
jgi:hypothetical protein